MANGAVLMMNGASSCPVCSTAERTVVERVGAYTLYRCAVCDLTYADPMEEPPAPWYDAVYAVRHAIVDDRIQPYYRWATARLPPGGALLDVGCGEGAFVAFARAHGYEAYGVDFSVGAIAVAQRRYGESGFVVGGPAEARSLRPGLFDAVTCFEVIEHVSSPLSLLCDLRASIATGGWLILSTPNRDRWPLREFVDYPPHHLTRWSRRALREAAERAGFKVEVLETTSRAHSMNYFFGYAFRAGLYRALGRYRRGLAAPSPRGDRVLASAPFRRVGPLLRRMRDAAMWIPAALAFPAYFAFQGYHLVMKARRPEGL
jgi:SAM-dependent methyltransferase